MKDRILNWVINNYNHFVKDIDFAHMPERESEEYRQLVLKTANDQIFSDGRYSSRTEMTQEIFDREDVQQALCDLTCINKLDEGDRVRLRFYLDLKETCYPLFHGQQVDWSAWPWNMKDDHSSLLCDELYVWLIQTDLLNLAGAICYDLQQQVWERHDFYTSVARQEISEEYEYCVKSNWERHPEKLSEGLHTFVDSLWEAENHMLVGRQLGFDFLTQSVYDALNTFVDKYRNRQINYAREMGAWLHEHWTVGEAHPAKERVEELFQVMNELMTKHHVESPDLRYSWNILILDVLGMSMFSDEQDQEFEDYDDDKIWEPEQDDLD